MKNGMTTFTLTAGLLTAGITLPAAAQLDGDRAAEELRQLREELARTNANMNTMRAELDQLRASSGEQWLSEQRTNEIRALVGEILADADTRSSLLQDSFTAGWADHFFMSSPDGRFKLQLEGQMQMRYLVNRHDQPDRYIGGFENTRTRLAFRGHVFNRDLTYMIRGAFDRGGGPGGGNFRLEDAWVRFELNNDFSLRFGQFKTPFNREELIYSGYQQAVERSLVNESINLGYTQGIEFAFVGENWRVMAAIGDGGQENLGGFGVIDPGGDPANSTALSPGVEWALTTRFEYKLAGTWKQFEDFTSPPDEPFGLMIGVAGHMQRGEHGAPAFLNQQEEWYAYTIDVSAEFGGANAFLSFAHHIIDGPSFDIDVYGVVAQAGYYFTPNFEMFARYEWGQFLVDLSGTAFKTLHVATIGGNYYFDSRNRHAAKFTFDLGYGFENIDASWDSDLAGWRSENDNADPQIVLRLQLQLLF